MLWLNSLSVSSMERTLVEAERISLYTLGEVQTRVWVVEMVTRVIMLCRASTLVLEVLDLTVEPLRRIVEGSGVIVEEGLSESEGDFKECRDIL